MSVQLPEVTGSCIPQAPFFASLSVSVVSRSSLMMRCEQVTYVSSRFSEYVQGLHKLFFITFAFVVGAIFSETLAAMAGENMILDLSGPDNRYAVLDLRQTRSRRSG